MSSFPRRPRPGGHGRRPMTSSNSRTAVAAAGTAASTTGLRPMPSSIDAGSQPTTSTRVDRAAEAGERARARRPGSCGGRRPPTAGRRRSRSGSSTETVPGSLALAERRRRGRGRRSRRAARRRGARRGSRSRRPRTPVGQRRAGQAAGHLDAEAVVAEEDVADAGDQHPSPQLHLVGREVEVAAVRRQQLGGRIVVEGDGEVVARRRRRGTPRRRWRAGRRGTGRGRRRGATVGARPACPGRRRARRRRPCRRTGRRRASTPGSHHGAAPGCDGSGAGADARQRADGAVQPLPHLGRHVVPAVDDGRGASDPCPAPRPSPRR